MSGPRAYLMEQLTPLLNDYRLIPWDDAPTITQKTVLFYRSKVIPNHEAPLGSWEHTITLYVATPKQVGAEALDALDEALDEVLVALHQVTSVTWESATYKVIDNVIPAFEVAVQVWTKTAPTQPDTP